MKKGLFRLIDILTLSAFAAALFGILTLTVLKDKPEYSIFENRTLAPVPTFSAQALFDGSYFSAWETWFSDRVAGRGTMLSAYTALQMDVLKKPVVNNIVVTERSLLPYQTPVAADAEAIGADAQAMAERLSALDAHIRAYGGTFLYVGLPEQRSMLRGDYPPYLADNHENFDLTEHAFFSALDTRGVNSINMRSVFLSEPDAHEFYSSVDHHFNLAGAVRTYEEIIARLSPALPSLPPAATIKATVLANPYYGSRNRMLYNLYPTGERLSIPDIPASIPFERFDNGAEAAPSLLSLPADTSTPVTYSVYMGGDIAETVIRTNRKELPSLLIFGDSFTNPLETLLYRNFDETRSLDLRHYDKMPLSAYIDAYRPDVVLCVRDDTSYLLFDGNGNFS